MNTDIFHINLTASWLGILLGILSGMLLGMGFLSESFLGGYSSVRRRLYRLAHISFFGLAFINFLFWLTVRLEELSGGGLPAASAAFLVGAISMPLCCVLTAHFRPVRHLFVVPVLSLLFGAGCTLFNLTILP